VIHLHNWLLASLSIQLQLQFPHPVLAFPQLLSSPPLTLFALSLQLGKLLSTLLKGDLQLLHSATEILILLPCQIKVNYRYTLMFGGIVHQ